MIRRYRVAERLPHYPHPVATFAQRKRLTISGAEGTRDTVRARFDLTAGFRYVQMPTRDLAMPDEPHNPLGNAEWANVAVVFTDIVDSTGLINESGDRKWAEIRKAHFAQANKLLLANHASST